MEALKTVWNFIQDEVLGMNWLDRLLATILNAVGLDTTGKIGSIREKVGMKKTRS